MEKDQDKGWFYNNFVKGRTYQDRRAAMIADSNARKGKIDTLFDNSFRYTAWLEVHRSLKEVGQKSISPAEALQLKQQRRAVLLDVREGPDFERAHPEGSLNAPLFRQIQGNDMKANMRRLGYALMTDFAGTERNPDFLDQALRAVGGDKKKTVVVMCAIGGTLDGTVEKKGKKFVPPERIFGRQSRSLKACYELREAGFKNVLHLKGGLNDWFHEDLP